MEDKFAGKQTPSNPPVDSPKKVFNPIGTQSQWSLGWNTGSKDIFNKPNSSKGISQMIQVLIYIIIKVVSFWEKAKEVIGKRTNLLKPLT